MHHERKAEVMELFDLKANRGSLFILFLQPYAPTPQPPLPQFWNVAASHGLDNKKRHACFACFPLLGKEF